MQGVHTDISYVKGANNVKLGAQYQQTFLGENDSWACVDRRTEFAASWHVSGEYAACALYHALAVDLTRGGTFYDFQRPHGREGARALRRRPDHDRATGCSTWGFAATSTTACASRAGGAAAGRRYNIKRTNTVLRVSYARTLETPFNENLVLSSKGCYR